MSRARGLQQYRPLLTGLVTEANPLEFPEGSTVDELNFSYDTNRNKRVRRRGLETVLTRSVTVPTGYEISSVVFWKSAGYYLVGIYNSSASVGYLTVLNTSYAIEGTFTVPAGTSSTLAGAMNIGEISDRIAVLTSPSSTGEILALEVVSGTDMVLFSSPIYYRDMELLPVTGVTSADRVSSTGEGPTPTMSRPASPGLGGTVEVTIDFDREVIGFDFASLSPDDGSINSPVKVSDTQWTVDFTAGVNTVGSLEILVDSYTDLYGANGNGANLDMASGVSTVIPSSNGPDAIGLDTNFAYNVGNAGWTQKKINTATDLLSDKNPLYELVRENTGQWPAMSEYPVNYFRTDPDNGREYFDLDLFKTWSPTEAYAPRGRFIRTLDDDIRLSIDEIPDGITSQPLTAISSISL